MGHKIFNRKGRKEILQSSQRSLEMIRAFCR